MSELIQHTEETRRLLAEYEATMQAYFANTSWERDASLRQAVTEAANNYRYAVDAACDSDHDGA